MRPLPSREQLLTYVHDGDLDAGLLFDTGDALGALGFFTPELDYLDLERVPLGVVAAADHPLAHRTNVTVEELSAQPLLVSPTGRSFRNGSRPAVPPRTAAAKTPSLATDPAVFRRRLRQAVELLVAGLGVYALTERLG